MITVGTDIKININIEPISGQTMDDMELTCVFYAQSIAKNVVLKKKDMLRVDENNYVACINTHDLGRGYIKIDICAQIHDTDFKSGMRREVETIRTDIFIK